MPDAPRRGTEPAVAAGLTTLMLVAWAGFLVHRAPTFAGSTLGLVLGIAGAVAIAVPGAYSLIKRIAPLRAAVLRRTSMRTLLRIHVVAGLIGPILALLHTGHRFASPLGIVLTATMLALPISGYVGRYVLGQVSRDLSDKSRSLEDARAEYARVVRELSTAAADAPIALPLGPWLAVQLAGPGRPRLAALRAPERLAALSGAIAELEHAIGMHERFRALFRRWLAAHIVVSVAFYAMLVLHVVSEAYLGIRWFR